jgi:alkanesulfonate monooxygenase SsuD/methylene tetrahydromethanopterin reductase-like flavin-dependent oxidoreductase (luciferase family)
MTLHLALALNDAGWHPAAWRIGRARPTDLLTARYWADVVQEAERGLLDLVTFEDSLGLQSSDHLDGDRRTDQVRGRLDSVLVANAIAPITRHIGLVPSVVVRHTEPFHTSKAIATLDYASAGRAGLRVRVGGRADEAAVVGRRPAPDLAADTTDPSPTNAAAVADLFDEAAEYVEVVRRLWDSWEDDAEIRDVATGRFVDVDKLHYIDFAGSSFSVKGPSITPRPPQGQPIVAALGHGPVPHGLIASSTDLGFVTPRDADHAQAIVAELGELRAASARADEPLHVFADLDVFLDADGARAADTKARLDELAGERYASDAHVFVGTPTELADLLLDWYSTGLTGFRLRPGTIPDDLEVITRGLVPVLQERGKFRRAYESDTLRGLLGLSRPANRYAAV